VPPLITGGLQDADADGFVVRLSNVQIHRVVHHHSVACFSMVGGREPGSARDSAPARQGPDHGSVARPSDGDRTISMTF